MTGPDVPRLRLSGLRSALAGPFDLIVASKAIIGITGASGSGKSLFLRMLADLDVNEGLVELDGLSRASFPAPDWRRKVAYIPAEPAWWSEMVIDHFSADTRDIAAPLARTFGLQTDLLHGPVSRLSTGERQRLALVRAFVTAPSALLLDEPTAALDPDATLAVERYLVDYARGGGAVIIVSHNPGQVRRIATAHHVMAARRLAPAA